MCIRDSQWVDQTGGIPDAPSDGEQYARQDGAWSVVETVSDELTFNAPLQRTGDDVSFVWNSMNVLP